MIRSAASKVMWVGRATVFLVGLAVILALLFGVATAALGANGDNFILGSRDNKATAITKLVGNVAGGPALHVVNNNAAAGSRGLQLGVAEGKAPLRVNASAGKATNLNADMVDGQDSTAFMGSNSVRADGTMRDTPIDDFKSNNFTPVVSHQLTAPSDGFLFIVGSIGAEDDSTLAGSGRLLYRIRLDSTVSTPNDAAAYSLDYGEFTTDNLADSGAASAVMPVSAGNHTIHLDAADSVGSVIFGRSITAIFVPNGSSAINPN